MPRLEQIAYDAGRSALSDQEALVAGVRSRTGTLLAAHALVASFLGAIAVRAHGLHALGWVALVALGFMSWLSGVLGVLMVLQTIAWLAALAVT
jgi:hypothetical protein